MLESSVYVSNSSSSISKYSYPVKNNRGYSSFEIHINNRTIRYNVVMPNLNSLIYLSRQPFTVFFIIQLEF